MDLRDLESFQLIASLGHVSQAAERLGVTQSGLTKCIRRLEAEFACVLFRRKGRLLELTEAGRALAEGAERMRLSFAETQRQVAEIEAGQAGTVRLGIGAPVADLILPAALADVLKEAPGAQFELHVGDGDLLQVALERGEIDMRIGPMTRKPGPAYEYHFLRIEDSIIAARKGHRLAKNGITIEDLAQAGWALPRPTVGARIWLEQVFKEAGLPPPRVVIETNLIHVQPRLIAATDLLTVISRPSMELRDTSRYLVELPLPKTVLHRRFGICWRKNAYLSVTAHKVIAAVLRHERQGSRGG